jgi:hypothetical protein
MYYLIIADKAFKYETKEQAMKKAKIYLQAMDNNHLVYSKVELLDVNNAKVILLRG